MVSSLWGRRVENKPENLEVDLLEDYKKKLAGQEIIPLRKTGQIKHEVMDGKTFSVAIENNYQGKTRVAIKFSMSRQKVMDIGAFHVRLATTGELCHDRANKPFKQQ